MDPSGESPVGKWGRTTLHGGITDARWGEVAVSIRGAAELFYARSADGDDIPPDTEVVVVDYQPPRTVTVSRASG